MNKKFSSIQNWLNKMVNDTTKERLEKTLILILLGLFILIAIPPKSKTNNEVANSDDKQITFQNQAKESEKDAYISSLENKLKHIIEGMEGAGTTHIMITLKNHGEKILDKNQPYENEKKTEKDSTKELEDSRIHSEQETVLIEQNGDTVPFIVMERYPEIEGVVVVCEGGNNKELVLRIKEAVQALFDIDMQKVFVCKSHN